jgi:hypothetical protein
MACVGVNGDLMGALPKQDALDGGNCGQPYIGTVVPYWYQTGSHEMPLVLWNYAIFCVLLSDSCASNSNKIRDLFVNNSFFIYSRMFHE